jgi:hypothetical protein
VYLTGLGHDIQKRLLERLEEEKKEAVELAERDTWEKAEKKKQQAVKKAREEAEKKTEKALAEQKKYYEQLMKVIYLFIFFFPLCLYF